MNRLIQEKSAYLRHASHQKIDWYPWSDEPFDKAQEEGKPVFLSSGAVWCHWCHVMAKESFEDEEVAAILNGHFVAIKLDRDERPDIDRRYQQAVAALGLGSGWPLSVFLTSDRMPFYGGTYFPLDDQHGRPGFRSALKMVAQLYEERREEVVSHGAKIVEFLKGKTYPPGEIGPQLVAKGLGQIVSGIDRHYGGFGRAPKFPMSGAVGFLLGRYFLDHDSSLEKELRNSLKAMAQGGYRDHLGGGFHRYSTDEAWIVPHFEKMTDDNAWLLRNYAHAYAIFGDPFFKEVAEGIVTFMRRDLSDPGGGFYASQDADVTPDDEGGYFTWTDEEFRYALTREEYEVLSRHLYHDRGVMHHDPRKRVLAVANDVDEVARQTGIDAGRVRAIIAKGKEKLLARRDGREKPFIDNALYTSLNGMAIGAFLEAHRVLKDEDSKAFALKSLDVILKARLAGGQVFHAEGVEGLLDDYVYLGEALVAAYEGTANPLYRDLADMIMDETLKRFWDQDGGGFLDSEANVLGIKVKGVEDTPQPSANSVAIMLLLKLFSITGKEAYLRKAKEALDVFALDAEAMGIHAGYYLVSLDWHFNGLKLDVHAPAGSALAEAALATFHPYTTIVYRGDEGSVVPCYTDRCLEPLRSPDAVRTFLRSGK
jgi:uncharacterized protein